MIELKDGMARTVYSSSLIGMRDFDLRYLTNKSGEEAVEQIIEAFVDKTPNLVRNDPDFARDIMLASLRRSVIRPVANGLPLFESRPLFEALLEQVPADTKVGVYLEVDPSWRRYLPLPSDGLVSRRADIKLEPGGRDDAYRHDEGSGWFRVSLDLPWNNDALRQLAQAIDIPYQLKVRYEDGSEDSMSGRMHLNPVPEVEQAYPFGLSFAALVDETHPWVKSIIDDINQRPEVKAAQARIAGGGGTPIDRLESIYLVWQDLVARGLRYQNMTAADGIAQRCRLVHESIGTGNANCVDGTVLLASFLEAMAIDSYIVLLPGHALLCADGGDQWIFIETTAMGSSVRGDPQTAYDDSFARLRSKAKLFRTPQMDLLEAACGSALGTVSKSISDAQQVLASVRAMSNEYAQNRNTPAWRARFDQVAGELANQIMIVPVSLARRNGVRPVGAPSDLDRRFAIPPRQ